MRVLVACEFSGIVRDAFRARGHDAWSCDLVQSEQSGQHVVTDAVGFAYGGHDWRVPVADWLRPDQLQWDLMIAHPPCTHLAVSGARWFKDKQKEQEAALQFVYALMHAPIPRIAIENPISIISSRIRKPDQIIQPHEYGHDASKKTCLWLNGLPQLRPTKHVQPRIVNGKPRWSNQTDSGQNRLSPSDTRASERARTYQGIADAMADQWGAT
jgi:hypothetical protein